MKLVSIIAPIYNKGLSVNILKQLKSPEKVISKHHQIVLELVKRYKYTARAYQYQSKGYTLIELLIVQVFVGIICSLIGFCLSNEITEIKQTHSQESLRGFEKLEQIYLSEN